VRPLTRTGPNQAFNLKASIYSGLYSSSVISLPYPPYSCPTGNCTWDPFPTLGVSVQCFDNSAMDYCSETDSISWSNRSFPSCHRVAPNQVYQKWNLSSLGDVYYSHWVSSLVSPKADTPTPPYNFSGFNYGFDRESPDTSTSINAGTVEFH
jgi:hypothetical protein